MSIRNSLIKQIDGDKQKIISLSQRLIQIKSVYDNEAKVARVVKKDLSKLGIKAKIQGRKQNRKNLIATIKGVQSGKTLLFSGHMDTVPIGDRKKWRYRPFSGKLVGNKIYGRGSQDMKGALAAFVYAFGALKEYSEDIGGTVILGMNYDEETGSHAGISEMLKSNLKIDAAIVGEPVRRNGVPIGSRGSYRFKATALGKSSHTGAAHSKGLNAVKQMSKFILALDKLKPKYTKHPLFPPPRITPGTIIRGGTAINMVPHRCKAVVDCRLSYGQTKESIKRDVGKQIKRLKKKDHFSNIITKDIGYMPPVITDGRERIVKKVCKNYERVMKHKPKLLVTGGLTDGSVLMQKGTPTVICGPRGGNMHSENEYVNVNSIIKVAKIYALTAFDFLKISAREKNKVAA